MTAAPRPVNGIGNGINLETSMTLLQLETPAALVDLPRMRANLARAAEYCRKHSLAWRPHVKTHKTPELARMQVAAGAVGVTVSTPGEAVVMASAVDDLLLAYPPLGAGKLNRLMSLPAHVKLTVALDSREALQGLASAASAANRTVGVLVELDMGMRRVGVQTPDDAIALAREAVDLPGVEYRGILFYPGHIRAHVDDQAAAITKLSTQLAIFRDALTDAGLAPAVVSGGSTPTFWRSHEIEGLTEVRPGTNIFNDRTTALMGACDWSECAYSVLTTVVSTAVPGQAVIDAGSKALAKEELRAEGGGFGALLDRPDIIVKSLSEEHGMLDLSGTDWRPRVGDQVRVVPNHVCVSVNLQERLRGIEKDQVTREWIVAGRSRTPA